MKIICIQETSKELKDMLNKYNYTEALHLSNLFYQAQRSGTHLCLYFLQRHYQNYIFVSIENPRATTILTTSVVILSLSQDICLDRATLFYNYDLFIQTA